MINMCNPVNALALQAGLTAVDIARGAGHNDVAARIERAVEVNA